MPKYTFFEIIQAFLSFPIPPQPPITLLLFSQVVNFWVRSVFLLMRGIILFSPLYPNSLIPAFPPILPPPVKTFWTSAFFSTVRCDFPTGHFFLSCAPCIFVFSLASKEQSWSILDIVVPWSVTLFPLPKRPSVGWNPSPPISWLGSR